MAQVIDERNTSEVVYKNILESLINKLQEKKDLFYHLPDKYFQVTSAEIHAEAKRKAVKDVMQIVNTFFQDNI